MKNINSVKIPKLRGKRDFKFEDCEAEIKRQIRDKFENPQYFEINSSRDGYETGYVKLSFLDDAIMSFGLPDNIPSDMGVYSFKLMDDSLADFYWEGKTFNDFKTDLNEALDIWSSAKKISLKSSKAREFSRYPKTASRNEVVHGKDENGNAVFVNSLDRFGVFSSALLKFH